MKTKRIGIGEYEAIDGRVRIYNPTKHTDDMGNDVWFLIVDGEFWSDYATKREAVRAVERNMDKILTKEA